MRIFEAEVLVLLLLSRLLRPQGIGILSGVLHGGETWGPGAHYAVLGVGGLAPNKISHNAANLQDRSQERVNVRPKLSQWWGGG